MMELENLTRREFFEIGGRIAASSALSELVPAEIFAQRNDRYAQAYLEAIFSPIKRQEWINMRAPKNGLPPYVRSVDYATPDILRDLREKNIFVPPPIALMSVIAEENEKMGKGTKSRILIHDAIFINANRKYQEFANDPGFIKDWEIILSNQLLDYHFNIAKYTSEGLPKYPIEKFYGLNGVLNTGLFRIAIQILSAHSEYSSLAQNSRFRSSRFLQRYNSLLLRDAMGFYNALSLPQIANGMDINFINQLRKDLNPEVLYKTKSR